MPSELSLFRQEAIDFQRQNRQWGHVASLQPVSTKLLAWLLALALALVFVGLFMGQYARKETVAGYLTPTAGTAKIFAPRQGTIKAVYVKEGQAISQGQELLAIDTNQIAGDGQDVNAAMLDTLTFQRDLLKKQIAAEQERGQSEHDRLQDAIRSAAAEIAQLEAQIKIQGERVEISAKLVATATELRTKGYMSDVELKRRQLTQLEQKQSRDALAQQLVAQQSTLTQKRYALQQLPTVTADKVQTLRNELSDVEQHIVETNGRRAYVIRAPASGRVSTLQAKVGQFADPKRLEMEIVPADSTLQAELYVPPRAIGFVKPGQEVRILYDAFPYEQFGAYRGHVVKVSKTILTGSDAAGPIRLNEPAYRVTVALDRPDIDAHGRKIALQPDMLLHADIILERRSLMRWLLDPLLSVRG